MHALRRLSRPQNISLEYTRYQYVLSVKSSDISGYTILGYLVNASSCSANSPSSAVTNNNTALDLSQKLQKGG